MPRSKTILTFHSGGYPVSEEGKAADRRTLRGFVLRRFNLVIGVNKELVEFFERVGVSPRRIRLIHPHALATQAPADSLLPQLKKFFETNKPVLTTVGLLEPEYDLPLQIEVLDLVHKRFPNAGLVIVGSGSLEEECEIGSATSLTQRIFCFVAMCRTPSRCVQLLKAMFSFALRFTTATRFPCEKRCISGSRLLRLTMACVRKAFILFHLAI